MARIIRNNPETSSLPIIFLTAKDSENDRLTGFTIGADDYISKPFSIREVMARIKAVIRRVEARNQVIEPELLLTYEKLEMSLKNKKVKLLNVLI